MVDVLHVFSPMGEAREMDYASKFVGQNDKTQHELVGMITGYPVDDRGLGMARRDFPGIKATFVTRVARHSENKIGTAIYLALWVDSMEAAQALPGFVPIFEYSGGFWMPPSIAELVFTPADEFDGVPIKRVDVGGDFVTPDYNDEGFAKFSLIPLGQLGIQIFFKDDPSHFYVIIGALLWPERDGELIAVARRFRETF